VVTLGKKPFIGLKKFFEYIREKRTDAQDKERGLLFT